MDAGRGFRRFRPTRGVYRGQRQVSLVPPPSDHAIHARKAHGQGEGNLLARRDRVSRRQAREYHLRQVIAQTQRLLATFENSPPRQEKVTNANATHAALRRQQVIVVVVATVVRTQSKWGTPRAMRVACDKYLIFFF